MKKLISAALTASLLLSSTAGFAASASFTPPPPEIAGKAYFLYDFYSGRTIAQMNPDQRVSPASLTKLMTAYVVFKNIKAGRLKLDQTVLPSANAWKTGGSRMFVDPRTPVTINDLIHGMIIVSGNDACVALAETVGGSSEVFVQMMNREAANLGMRSTHFNNVDGLPDANHYTSVRDLATVSAALVRDFPEFYPLYSMKSFTYNHITQPNRNLLLYRDPSVDGMKTGYTDDASYNLVASSHRDGRRVISVVVGTASPEARAVESSKLLNYGLQFFDTPRLYAANKPVSTVKVYKGSSDSVGIGFQHDIYSTVPKGTASQIKVQMTTTQPLIAPVKAGQAVGKLTLTLDGKTIAEQPVVALKAVDEGGFFSRLFDTIRLWFA